MYVGVDGCPAGWFVVRFDGASLECSCAEAFGTVVERNRDAERLLVDIPIGLPEDGVRRCDDAARSRLGSRASTVFSAPCRAVLDADSHEDASRRNRTQTGRGLSIQAWSLVPRIRAVDAVLRRDAHAREQVVESHPELCFRAFAGGDPVTEPKSTDAGQSRRLELLESLYSGVDSTYDDALAAHYRKDVGRDDVLDAIGLAIAASMPLERLPPDHPTDGEGLSMTIAAPEPRSPTRNE